MDEQGPSATAPARSGPTWRTTAAVFAQVCGYFGGVILLGVALWALFILSYGLSIDGPSLPDGDREWVIVAGLVVLTQVVLIVVGRRGSILISRGRPSGPGLAVLAGLILSVEGAWLTRQGGSVRVFGVLAVLCGLGAIVAAAVLLSAGRRTTS
ncbi:hypothetical protein [Luteipulveratus mongoliensis]|uniref:Uncharacterized protein n=1 Tax=Luteipulveratus mongoliensis TaxID=571913 RepID=A0A0K1JI89_9MICO|nr:hypothetical protein [Luteipulveratus mongoliensis]AKU16295.1 hypothetical protein VV02_11185 [Luteipulveratus mongoliensis]